MADARSLTPKVIDLLSEACVSPHTVAVKQVWLVCGMPNTGKSTLINSIIGSEKKAPVSSIPGFTRGQTFYNVKRKKVNSLLFDTPGVMVPGVLEPLHALNLALCGLIEDHRIPGGVGVLTDYLFHIYSERQRLGVIREYFKIPPHCAMDSAEDLVQWIEEKHGKFTESSHGMILSTFRQGKLGSITLDQLPSTQGHEGDKPKFE
eukprot:TRINITY_DN4023_c0_g1_i2.p1 TRINITY_DN4023_c0_g1~~TRINITY_DN4023_c0_g1_i2.p1  ORF type:complete len:205 (+),score=16.98 TRINITY_DN4023_c0_g1_i2:418-1032(+)